MFDFSPRGSSSSSPYPSNPVLSGSRSLLQIQDDICAKQRITAVLRRERIIGIDEPSTEDILRVARTLARMELTPSKFRHYMESGMYKSRHSSSLSSQRSVLNVQVT